VIELFERHRATPGAPYDEQHFLDFLLPKPRKARAVYNSFRGLRRFNSFLDNVQMEFAICFSMKDRDANYSLDRFVERVAELEKSRRGSLVSLKNQVRAGAGWHAVVLANLLLVVIGSMLRATGWAIVVVVVVAVLLNTLFVRFARRSNAYHARLRARIEDLP
jgi:hypothetical protein